MKEEGKIRTFPMDQKMDDSIMRFKIHIYNRKHSSMTLRFRGGKVVYKTLLKHIGFFL
jgi:hypothetical protein